MDPAVDLNHSALLILSWLSHREDANRLFGTDPLKKCCVMLAALSQEHFTDSETNKQLAATRWDDAEKPSRRNKQLTMLC